MTNLLASREAVSTDKPSIKRLLHLTAPDMVRVNQHILDRLQSPVALIPQLAGHIIAAGGKRLRPILTLGAAGLCGYRGDRHIGLAVCVEFIHTATLLHDDVVDASLLRRGQDSANAVWGNQASVLVGDFLFSRAFQLMVADGSLNVLKILSDASATIAEGEVQQLRTVNDPETSVEAYLEVVRGKTATLFAAAAQTGAAVAMRPVEEEKALHQYGLNLGIAFQLVDDVLDYSARQAVLGKTVGDDFREGKVTLPIILAWQRGNAAERKFWRRTIAEQTQQEDDLAEAQNLLQKHNTLVESMQQAHAYSAQAIAALDLFPNSNFKTALVELAEFCVDREY